MHIDLWTLGFQAINASVLVWLLARFLFRPVTAIIAKRQAAVTASLDAAQAIRQQAAAEAADLARQRQEIAAEADGILARARAASIAERDARQRQAEVAVTEMQAAATAAIEHDRDAMLQSLDAKAADLAVTIAERLLRRLSSHTVSLALCDALASSLGALPEPERRRLIDAEEPLDVVTASALDATEEAACRGRLLSVIGPTAELRFSVDPALLGGIELRGRHTLIRNSWRADLDAIEQELQSDHVNDVTPRHVA